MQNASSSEDSYLPPPPENPAPLTRVKANSDKDIQENIKTNIAYTYNNFDPGQVVRIKQLSKDIRKPPFILKRINPNENYAIELLPTIIDQLKNRNSSDPNWYVLGEAEEKALRPPPANSAPITRLKAKPSGDEYLNNNLLPFNYFSLFNNAEGIIVEKLSYEPNVSNSTKQWVGIFEIVEGNNEGGTNNCEISILDGPKVWRNSLFYEKKSSKKIIKCNEMTQLIPVQLILNNKPEVFLFLESDLKLIKIKGNSRSTNLSLYRQGSVENKDIVRNQYFPIADPSPYVTLPPNSTHPNFYAPDTSLACTVQPGQEKRLPKDELVYIIIAHGTGNIQNFYFGTSEDLLLKSNNGYQLDKFNFGVLVEDGQVLDAGGRPLSEAAQININQIINGEINMYQRYTWRQKVTTGPGKPDSSELVFPNILFGEGGTDNPLSSFTATIIRVLNGKLTYFELSHSKGRLRRLTVNPRSLKRVSVYPKVREGEWGGNYTITLGQIIKSIQRDRTFMEHDKKTNIIFATCLGDIPKSIHDFWLGRVNPVEGGSKKKKTKKENKKNKKKKTKKEKIT